MPNDGTRAPHRRYGSPQADAFRAAWAAGDYHEAVLQLNGLNMYEMARCLAELGGGRANIRAAAQTYAGEINEPRITWALDLCDVRLLPPTAPGDLEATGQVQDGADWLASEIFLPVARSKNPDAAGHISRILMECWRQGVSDPSHVAYVLGTVHHESNMGALMTELASGDAYEGRRDLGNTEPGDGRRFKGRGYVQITGRNHYTRYTERLVAAGHTGVDLVANPEQATDPDLAAFIVVHGMSHGAFTGRRLSQYGADGSFDFVHARAIVNGSDRAQLIAGYAQAYRERMGSRMGARAGFVVLDAGHGGHAPAGKSSPYGHRAADGAHEKDLTLRLARDVAAALGGRARLTRQGDVNLSLAERMDVARGAAAFVSLHTTAPGAGGSTVWVHPRAGSGARALGQRVAAALGGCCVRCDEEMAVLAPERLHTVDAVLLEVDVDELSRSGTGRVARSIAAALGAVAPAAPVRRRRAYGGTVRFPSGEELSTVSGATGEDEEHWDPTGANLPLLDISGAEGDKRLSANFVAREFGRSGANRAGVVRIDPELVNCLQTLRDHVGRGLTISSGYRSWAYNKALYEARHQRPTRSQHCAGRAADVMISGMTGLDIAKAALDAYGCDLAIGLAANYAHIDVRGRWTAWTYESYANGEADLAELRRYRADACAVRGQALSAPRISEGEDSDVGEDEAAIQAGAVAQGQAVALEDATGVEGDGWPFEVVPEGTSTGQDLYGTYQHMTECERSQAWRHPIEAFTVRDCAQEALTETRRRYPTGGHNDVADAFRHAFWNYRMAQELGAARTQVWADCHEDFPTNPAGERAMDLHNNGVGRDLFTAPEGVLGGARSDWSGWSGANLVEEAIRRGALQTAP